MSFGERLPSARALLKPLLLLAATIGVGQAYFVESPHLSPNADLAGSLLVPLAGFGLFLLFVAWERRPLADFGFRRAGPLATTLGVAFGLLAVQSILLYEPGLAFGFLRLGPPSVLAVGFTLALSPLSALEQESVFRGFIFGRLLAPRRFAAATAISSGGFAIALTNLPVLGLLPPVAVGAYLLSTTATAFILGVMLAFYYYRGGRSLIGPLILRTGALLIAALSPLVALSSGWLFTMLLQVGASGALLLLVVLLLREPRTVARRYLGESMGPRRDRFLSTMRRRRTIRDAAIAAVVVAVAIVGVAVGVEAGLGTSHPFLAIATGSMVPTLVRGDLVVIEHVPASAISVGTIVAYLSTCLPSPVVHRVIAISNGPNGTVYTTKGDANNAPDRCPVPYSAVLGKVIEIVPALGYFVLSPALAVGAVGLIALAGILISPSGRGRFPSRRSVT